MIPFELPCVGSITSCTHSGRNLPDSHLKSLDFPHGKGGLLPLSQYLPWANPDGGLGHILSFYINPVARKMELTDWPDRGTCPLQELGWKWIHS